MPPTLRFVFPLLLATALSARAQIPAFPGAEGYGAFATGGRGGDVYHVTNLNPSGTGSFADAIATVPGAGRTIVFDVSGHIHVNKTTLSKSKVTIAGQTAPGDGIGFKDGTFIISGDDIVIRHARFRYGKKAAGGDCIDLSSGTLSAILDQISIEYSTDENISSFSSPPENLTMQWSLNGWGLESHSCGGLWDQNHATSHHSLWAHNHTRNPKARPNGLLEWINNVTFDWDIGFIMGDSNSNASWKANVRGCYFLCPPGNLRSKALEKAGLQTSNGLPNFSLYLDNCLHDADGDGLLNGTNKGYGIASGSWTTAAAPFAGSTAGVAIDPPLLAFKKVLSKAGALRLDVNYAGPLRDEVDAKMVNNVATQTRNHISSETALGLTNGGFGTLNSAPAPVDVDRDGMPDFFETALGWSVAVDDHNTVLASSGGVITGTTFFPAGTIAGYTRLEEYLHYLAIPHGTVAKNSSVAMNLAKFTGGFTPPLTFAASGVVNGSVGIAGSVATFTPTAGFSGRARFDFTVVDSAGSTWQQTCALVVTNTSLPRDLVWKGDGSANAWDGANMWLRNGVAATYSGGDRVAFEDTGSLTPAVNIASAVSPTSVEVNAAGDYTLGGAGSLAASGPLTKRGAGRLTLTNSEAYTGGISLEGGTLAVSGALSLASGVLTMLDGTIFDNAQDDAITLTVPVPFEVPAGQSATIKTGNRVVLSGAVTGAGTLNYLVETSVTRVDLRGAMAAFTGALRFTGGGGVRLYFNGGAFNGFNAASVDLGGSVSLQPHTNSGGNTCTIGALSGSSTSASLAGGDAGVATYVVGGSGTDTSFAGGISGNAIFTKVGTGALALTGPTSHTGATTVSAGDLLANGALGPSAITVASGAKLRGAGSVAGAVTMQAGSQLSPGAASGAIGTLTLGTAGLSLANMTTSLQLSSSPAGANDRVHLGGGALAMTGALNFNFTLPDGFLGAGEYFLIDGAASSTASGVTFTSNLPTSGTRQGFAITRPAAGATPAFIKLTVTGDAATLIWTGAAGSAWDTTTAGNWTGATPTTFFNFDAVTLDDTAANRTLTLIGSLLPRSLAVNTATGYTLDGAGTLDGTATLVKTGAGALTFATTGANTFSGGIILNEGALVLSNDAANAGALGTGPVTLNGGTLSMHDDPASYNAFTANLVVPAGATARLNADSRVDLSGTLTGGGTLNFFVPYIRTTLFANWSAFTGTINVLSDASGGDFRIGTSYSPPDFPDTTINLAPSVALYFTGTLNGGEGTTIEIGELGGATGSHLRGGATGGRALTYRIGGKTLAGMQAVFSGDISEQNAGTLTNYVKTGAGLWRLQNSTGAWNGGASVEQGTLILEHTAIACSSATNVASGAALQFIGGSSLATDALNIAGGATLSGSGNVTITGDLNNGGSATFSAGTISVTGDLVNDGTMRFYAGAQLVPGTAFTNNGLLDLLTSPNALPPNFINSGTVILNTERRILSAAKTGADFSCTVWGYAGHTYQLQRADVPGGPWTAIGGWLTGGGALLTFSDTGGAAGTARFYRVSVAP